MIQSEDLVGHMRHVQMAERDLRDLGMVWQMIESSAAISCPAAVAPILPTLMHTRSNFEGLRERLVRLMVGETAAATADELAAKAQCAIDILVRNLYERTADVGFLATDDAVRGFCCAADASSREAIVGRLLEYQAKYTVYDDVILLSPTGDVLARLDRRSSLQRSHDAIVADAAQAEGYVERFRSSDLGCDGQPALLYAHRITEGERGRVVGVLVLRFRFVDEMRRVFESINPDNPQLALVLLDEEQRVIASNEEAHVPIGARIASHEGSDMVLGDFAGRRYLCLARGSSGYQGYRGPPWRAQAMVSVLTAFRDPPVDAQRGAPGQLDNAELSELIRDTDEINRELRRVVWNGRLMASSETGDPLQLKAVLQQVNGAGVRTRLRVAKAIESIHGTALARARRQTLALARLAADVLDRNLYERANDCRWWALSPALRAGLDQGAEAGALAAVLDHINGLYTVYSRLVLFDSEGCIRAASRLAGGNPQELAGGVVPAEWLRAVGALSDSQRYAVSAFADTSMHDGGPTYTYLAAVRSPGEAGRLIGGIAIVFSSATELPAILRDVLAGHAGVAAFVDASGRVLAATDPGLAGALMPHLSSEVVTVDHEGTRYACARVRSSGYREFKASDGYDNGVQVVVGLRIGTSQARRDSLAEIESAASGAHFGRDVLEAAVFQVGSGRYALPIAQVLEAIPGRGLVRTSGGGRSVIGMVEPRTGSGSGLLQVLCARQLFGAHDAATGDGVILVLAAPGGSRRGSIGLRVDEVLTVLDLQPEQIHEAPEGLGSFAPWVQGIVDCRVRLEGEVQGALIQLVDATAVVGAVLPGWGCVREARSAEAPRQATVGPAASLGV